MGGGFIAKLKRLYVSLRHLIEERPLERLQEGSLSRAQLVLHVSVMSVRGFLRNRCPIRATALSYTTLLALVPLLAVGASITHTFLRERGSTRQLIEGLVEAAAPQLRLFSQVEKQREANGSESPSDTVPGGGDAGVEGAAPEDASKMVVDQIMASIEQFDTKAVGFSGLVSMIVVALLLISTIEGAFNDIWGVRRGRPWFQRLVTYWTTISLGPVIVVMAFVLLKNSKLVDSIFFDALPFLLISLGFGLLYKLMPNTHVQWRPALSGGIVGGCLWLLQNVLSALSLGRVAQMDQVYGKLAVVPIFLIGLYFSWLIVLFGAQVSYAIQNRKIHLQEEQAAAVSQMDRELAGLGIMTRVAEQFTLSADRPTVAGLSEQLNLSSRLVTLIIEPLLDADLLAEISGEEATYLPARPIEEITCFDILRALRQGGNPSNEPGQSPEAEVVLATFSRILDSEKQVASSITLKELVTQLEGPGKISRLDKKALS